MIGGLSAVNEYLHYVSNLLAKSAEFGLHSNQVSYCSEQHYYSSDSRSLESCIKLGCDSEQQKRPPFRQASFLESLDAGRIELRWDRLDEGGPQTTTRPL
jgi:hypothetical protein